MFQVKEGPVRATAPPVISDVTRKSLLSGFDPATVMTAMYRMRQSHLIRPSLAKKAFEDSNAWLALLQKE